MDTDLSTGFKGTCKKEQRNMSKESTIGLEDAA